MTPEQRKAEVQGLGAQNVSVSEGWVRCSCPHPDHDDANPSFFIHAEEGNWKCLSHPGGEFTGQWPALFRWFGKKAPLENIEQSPLGREMAARYATRLWNKEEQKKQSIEGLVPELMRAMADHHLNDQTLRDFEVGVTISTNIHEAPARLMFPHYTRNRKSVVAFTEYAPGLSTGKYNVNTVHGATPVPYFNMGDLDKPNVWIVGGVLKAMVLVQEVGNDEVGAISMVSGESLKGLRPNDFTDKVVFVCMDVDEKGRRAAKAITGALRAYAKAIYDVDLTGMVGGKADGDINDFFASGHTTDDLRGLVFEKTTPITKTQSVQHRKLPTRHVSRVSDLPNNVGVPIRLDAVSMGKSECVYRMPTHWKLRCLGRKGSPGEFCKDCPAGGGDDDLHAVPTPKDLIRFSQHRTKEAKVFRMIYGGHLKGVVPSLGPDCQISGVPVNEDTAAVSYSEMKISDADPSTQGDLRGLVAINPHTHEKFGTVVAIEGSAVTDDAFELFIVVDKIEHPLEKFIPTDAQLSLARKTFHCDSDDPDEVEQRWDDIIMDVMMNSVVAGQDKARVDLVRAIDLTLLSGLRILHTGTNTTLNGWLNTFILGDPGMGKTQSSKAMAGVYGLDWNNCSVDNVASLAGLIGGVASDIITRNRNERYVKWGALPQNDARVLFWDEVSRAKDPALLKELATSMSEGRVSISKISSGAANSRTRLVCMSNPGRPTEDGGRLLEDFAAGGFEALYETCPDYAMLRRFHLVSFLRKGAPQEKLKIPDHSYSNEAHRALLAWSWTNQESTTDLSRHIVDERYVQPLAEQFTEVSRGVVPEGSPGYDKVMAIAAAIARRVMCLEVKEVHVRLAARLIHRLYSSEDCGALQGKRELISVHETAREVRPVENRKTVVFMCLSRALTNPKPISSFSGSSGELLAELISQGYITPAGSLTPDGTKLYQELKAETLSNNES